MQNTVAEVPPQSEPAKKPQPFYLREKTEEMVHYSYPIISSFPRKDRELGDELKQCVLTIYRLSIEIDKRIFKKTTTQNFDVELAVLRGLVRLAANKNIHGGKFPPPLTMHQYEVWSRYNDEIGRLLGGYLKTL